jgi:hypothetical protein
LPSVPGSGVVPFPWGMLLNGLLDTVALFFPQAETISRIKRMDRKSQYLPPVIVLRILPFFLCMK